MVATIHPSIYFNFYLAVRGSVTTSQCGRTSCHKNITVGVTKTLQWGLLFLLRLEGVSEVLFPAVMRGELGRRLFFCLQSSLPVTRV